MRIYNPTYKKIALNWDSVELPVNEGTPFSADGTIANTSDAIGLLPVYIWKKPIDEEVYILIGGDVYQSEVEEAFGAELTDDAIASMGGINFYESDGTIDKSSGGGGGGDNGFFEVHYDDGERVLNKTWKEIDDAMRAGKQPFYVYTVEEDGYTNVTRYNCAYSIYDPDGESSQYQVLFYVNTIMQNQSPWVDMMPFKANSEDGYPFID